MYGTGQMSDKEAKECHLVKMLSAGFVVKEDRQVITLAQDWHPQDQQYRHVTVYPKSKSMHITREFVVEPKEGNAGL